VLEKSFTKYFPYNNIVFFEVINLKKKLKKGKKEKKEFKNLYKW